MDEQKHTDPEEQEQEQTFGDLEVPDEQGVPSRAARLLTKARSRSRAELKKLRR